ncbi:polar amino acid transport system substrate-binding protein [Pseudochelatococcus lubricantis]|uniref:Polar amino acid transport system substrate-binding protein n=1 Tax=Pseudochelatococcus lubricantis TaxID=1538102 RepID=A0ABX0UZN4_9HYPH|nr:transporter substrate-binding domain-containing protein [Pseudochelatococcus lubricantis]NIJ57838.1 polar amino acid transport system substrate-binding protein [Pseudochelatococcus lubricantis]
MRRLTVAASVALAAALAALPLATPASAKEWKTIRIATEGAYPPFNYTDSSGKVAGFEIDLAQAICEKANVTCTFQAQDWDGILPALLAGRYDAVFASMSITEERKKQVAFTKPYLVLRPSVAVAKDSPLKDASPESLKGKVLGVQSSTIHTNYAEGVYKDADIRLYPKQDEANTDLAGGRIDATMADKPTIMDFLRSKEGQACCKLLADLDNVLEYHGEGIGAALRKEDSDLKALLDKAIDEVHADGTFARIAAKYFDYKLD